MTPERAAELIAELGLSLDREIRRSDTASISLLRMRMLALASRLERETSNRVRAFNEDISDLEAICAEVEADLTQEEEAADDEMTS